MCEVVNLCQIESFSFCGSSLRLIFFFLMIRRPPRSTLFPTRRSSDLSRLRWHAPVAASAVTGEGLEVLKQTLVEVVDRKSTRLNSSHVRISYAVFCLKKKTEKRDHPPYSEEHSHKSWNALTGPGRYGL